MMSTVRSYLPETVNENVMYGIGVVRCYIQQYLSTEFNANALVSEPRILIGDLASASNRDAMKEQGITHVLCVLNGGLEQFPDEFEYMIVHANDDPWVEIDNHFENSIKFIDDALRSSKDAKILVHCQRGASRSVTLVSAYLLFNINRSERISEDNVATMVKGVIDEIRGVRDIANPNQGFVEALKRYICRINNYTYVPPPPPPPEPLTNDDLNSSGSSSEHSSRSAVSGGVASPASSPTVSAHGSPISSPIASPRSSPAVSPVVSPVVSPASSPKLDAQMN